MDMEPNVAEVAIFSSFWSLSLFVKLDDLRVEKLAAFREDVEEEEEGDDDDDDDEEEAVSLVSSSSDRMSARGLSLSSAIVNLGLSSSSSARRNLLVANLLDPKSLVVLKARTWRRNKTATRRRNILAQPSRCGSAHAFCA